MILWFYSFHYNVCSKRSVAQVHYFAPSFFLSSKHVLKYYILASCCTVLFNGYCRLCFRLRAVLFYCGNQQPIKLHADGNRTFNTQVLKFINQCPTQNFVISQIVCPETYFSLLVFFSSKIIVLFCFPLLRETVALWDYRVACEWNIIQVNQCVPHATEIYCNIVFLWVCCN
jgi:hypothetical protein